MDLHMVHIKKEYINADGSLHNDYLTMGDGLAVLGIFFDVNSAAGVHILYDAM